MTFLEYASALEHGNWQMKQVRVRDSVIQTQLKATYELISGFRDTFSKIVDDLPTKFSPHHKVLKAFWLDTKLGPMIAIADETALYLLEFIDRRGLERKVEILSIKTKAIITPGVTDAIQSIIIELESYFQGKLKKFKTPLNLVGTPFQRLVWEELIKIPYGTIQSYMAQTKAIERNKAYRALANANGANKVAIVIPCHRVINSNGGLGGYGAGIRRKEWLIEFEKRHV